nr:uncharacterized protein LOC107440378 [Parasteatoda tepidariorum]
MIKFNRLLYNIRPNQLRTYAGYGQILAGRKNKRRSMLSKLIDNEDKKCHVLLLAGDLSPHLKDSVTMNSLLFPTNSTWMKDLDLLMLLSRMPILLLHLEIARVLRQY